MGEAGGKQGDMIWTCPECGESKGVDICEFVPCYTPGNVELVDGKPVIRPIPDARPDMFYDGIDPEMTTVHCFHCRSQLDYPVRWW